MVAHGQTKAAIVNAQVKISICGNAIIEGGEDCEGSNLNGKACSNLGYATGTLSCDIACTFDTYACSVATLTPTPTTLPSTSNSTPTNTPTSTADFTILPSSSPTTTQVIPIATSKPLPTSFPSPKPSRLFLNTQSLPVELQMFDIIGSGKLSKETLPTIMQLWINEWKLFVTSSLGKNGEATSKKCDINHDAICDVRDFSVLMYYIER